MPNLAHNNQDLAFYGVRTQRFTRESHNTTGGIFFRPTFVEWNSYDGLRAGNKATKLFVSSIISLYFRKVGNEVVLFVSERDLICHTFWGFRAEDLEILLDFFRVCYKISATFYPDIWDASTFALKNRHSGRRRTQSFGDTPKTRHAAQIHLKDWIPPFDEDIKSHVLKSLRDLEHFTANCCRFNDHVIKKVIGSHVGLQQAAAMEFVRTQTSIPVPKVISAFTHDEDSYILMEFIEGVPFNPLQMSATQYAKQLLQYHLQLVELGQRCFSQPKLASWPQETYKNVLFPKNKAPTRPFTFLQEFQAYWKLRWGSQGLHWRWDRPATLQNDFPYSVGIVLCHSDLLMGNVLTHEGEIVAILDWETLGFYPDFWEVVQATKRLDFSGSELKHALEAAFCPTKKNLRVAEEWQAAVDKVIFQEDVFGW
ncbi:hypothetical protein BT69DRAFT_1355777 [Atractiella rhizophila]|nr:hypothetical protein BT69DRAFT_1355777 [Atractiella rhizophila]